MLLLLSTVVVGTLSSFAPTYPGIADCGGNEQEGSDQNYVQTRRIYMIFIKFLFSHKHFWSGSSFAAIPAWGMAQ